MISFNPAVRNFAFKGRTTVTTTTVEKKKTLPETDTKMLNDLLPQIAELEKINDPDELHAHYYLDNDKSENWILNEVAGKNISITKDEKQGYYHVNISNVIEQTPWMDEGIETIKEEDHEIIHRIGENTERQEAIEKITTATTKLHEKCFDLLSQRHVEFLQNLRNNKIR